MPHTTNVIPSVFNKGVVEAVAQATGVARRETKG